jgi:TolA-binding protein
MQNAESALLQPTNEAKHAQTRQSLCSAQSEIEELRQSLRYVEISLAKQREEKEQTEVRLAKSLKD